MAWRQVIFRLGTLLMFFILEWTQNQTSVFKEKFNTKAQPVTSFSVDFADQDVGRYKGVKYKSLIKAP